MPENPTGSNANGEPEFLAAARRRKKVPLWVVPIFPALLVWGIIYLNGVTNPPQEAATPDSLGAELYSAQCASCHGATGGGGTGPAFAGGDLLKVFPDWKQQVLWVNAGTSGWTEATGETTFGETKKPVDPGKLMPGFGPLGNQNSLSCQDILMVVRYEREVLAGADADEELNALADQIAAGESPTIPECAS